jgi:hypothetical protein
MAFRLQIMTMPYSLVVNIYTTTFNAKKKHAMFDKECTNVFRMSLTVTILRFLTYRLLFIMGNAVFPGRYELNLQV